MRSRNQRSCEITTAQPAKSSSASSSARSVSTSRSFVGSSSSSTLPPERSSFARWTRLRSPPLRSDDALLLVGAPEVEPGDVLARVDLAPAELDRVVAAGDLLPDRARRVEARARLVDVGQLDRLADAQLAGVRLLLAGDHAEERRLAGAVRADHADDAAGRQREGQVLDEQPVAVALLDAVRLDDDVAEPRARPGCGSRRVSSRFDASSANSRS